MLLFLRIQRCSNLSHLKIQTKISPDLIRNGRSVFFYLSLHVQILKKMFSRSHCLPSRLVFAALQPAVSPQTPWSCVSLFPGWRHFLSPCPTLPAKPGIAPAPPACARALPAPFCGASLSCSPPASLLVPFQFPSQNVCFSPSPEVLVVLRALSSAYFFSLCTFCLKIFVYPSILIVIDILMPLKPRPLS